MTRVSPPRSPSHRRPHSHSLLAAAASLTALHLAPLATAVTPATYTGPASGLWSDPANWSTHSVPNNAPPDTFDVTLGHPTQPTTLHFDLPAATIDNLTLTGLDPTLQISANHHLTLAGVLSTSTPANSTPTILVDGGSLSIPSPLPAPANVPFIQVANGGHAAWSTSHYSYASSLNSGGRGLFRAQGNGSLIDLSATTSFDATVVTAPFSSPTLSVRAYAGTTIDLSNLVTASGMTDRGDGYLSFEASGGTIKLDRLAQTTGGVRFEAGLTTLSLPALTHMERATLAALSGSTLDFPALRIASIRYMYLDRGTINAPHLTTLTHTAISLQQGTLNTGAISSLDHSSITVYGGAYSFPAVTSYTGPGFRTFGPGPGSLSFPALTSIDNSAMFSDQGPATYTVEAVDGTLDLSHVTTVIGPGAHPDAHDDWLRLAGGDLRLDALTHVSGNVEIFAGTQQRLPNLRSISGNVYFHARGSTMDLPNLHSTSGSARFQTEWQGTINLPNLSTASGPPAGSTDPPLRFTAAEGGTIHVGSLTHTSGRITVEINSGGRITAQDLWLGPDVSFDGGDGPITVTDTFVYTPASHAQSTLERAALHMTPAPGHTALLEAGVPIGNLTVGTPTQPAVVRVVDLYPSDGSTGPQALYLTGPTRFEFTGLELHPGSVLDLGGVDVYATILRKVIHLNALFTDGQTEIPWYGGTLRNTPFHPLPGDTAPFDGVVDQLDLDNVRDHLGATSPAPGDTAPFDGLVDQYDLDNVLAHLVPDPSLPAPLLLLTLPALTRRRRTGDHDRRPARQRPNPVRHPLRRSLLLAALPLTASTALAVPRYTPTDLGAFFPVDLNNADQAIGAYTNGSSDLAFFSDGTLTSIEMPDHIFHWYPRAINDHGDVVGRATVQIDPNFQVQAFLFRDNQYVPLGLPDYNEAIGINNAGQVAAFGGNTRTGPDRAYLIDATPGQPVAPPVDLGSLPGHANAWALDVNNAGHAVGISFGNPGTGYGALFANGSVTPVGPLPGHNRSYASAINDADQIVGYSFSGSADSSHAFLYDHGEITDLGYGTPNDINNAGLVVGDSGGHAVLFADHQVLVLGALIPLDSNWHLEDAVAINDAGHILCAAWLGGTYHAVLLTPTVPSPTSLLPLACLLPLRPRRRGATNQPPAPHHRPRSRPNAPPSGNHPMKHHLIPTLLAVIATFAAATPSLAAPRYTLTEIGPIGAHGINNRGQVVGSTYDMQPVIWADGNVTPIVTPTAVSFRDGLAINDLGDAVGYWDEHAFLHRADGQFTDLHTFFSGVNSTFASNINNLGQIIAFGVSSVRQTVLISGGHCTPLPLLPGARETFANDINNLGQIVGTAQVDSNSRAVLIEQGTILDFLPGGTISSARAINDAGQIVGAYSGSGVTRPFLYANGTMTDLGTLPGFTNAIAQDINLAGLAIGESWSALGPGRPVLFADGQVFDLNTLISPDSGWTLARAVAINDLGQIVCIDSDPLTTHSGAVLLTPTVPSPTPLLPLATLLLPLRPLRPRPPV